MPKFSDNETPSLLLDEQAGAPTTPATGFWRLYTKSDGLYLVDDAGVETGPFVAGTFLEDLSVAVETESGTTFTPALGDANTYQRLTNAALVTVTIPTNASVAYAVGTSITFRSAGAGGATLSPASGVTLNGDTSISTDETIVAVKVATDVWDLTGGTAA